MAAKAAGLHIGSSWSEAMGTRYSFPALGECADLYPVHFPDLVCRGAFKRGMTVLNMRRVSGDYYCFISHTSASREHCRQLRWPSSVGRAHFSTSLRSFRCSETLRGSLLPSPISARSFGLPTLSPSMLSRRLAIAAYSAQYRLPRGPILHRRRLRGSPCCFGQERRDAGSCRCPTTIEGAQNALLHPVR